MPSGIIGLTSPELGRFSEAYISIMGIHRPPGTAFMPIIGGTIAQAWNDIARHLLTTDAEWLLLLNDDHIFPQDTIARLLAHNVDVVSAFYLKRTFPFQPVLYDRLAKVDGQDWYDTYYPKDSDSGLVPIVGCGDGCLLIKRRVLETIPMPIWELSKYRPDLQSADLIFCEKVRKAGFQIYADLDLQLGHMIIAPIFPRKINGSWRVEVQGRDGVSIALPAAQESGSQSRTIHNQQSTRGGEG